jgi:cell wall assembly regulator SMI1
MFVLGRGVPAMQKFTRSLTREIELAGERLAVTLSEEGLSVRPVGARRPPQTMTWGAWLCACLAQSAGDEPSADEVQEAVRTLKEPPKKKRAAKGKPEAEEEAPEGEEGEGEEGAEEETRAPAAAPAADKVAGHAPAAGSAPAQHAGGRLEGLLARIDRWLAAHRSRFHRALQPPATAAECDRLAAALGGNLPPELRTWLTWHNGQSPDVPGAFEQNWNLMSAEQIAEAKQELDAEGHEGWQRAWVPFLDDDNGNYLCLDPATAGTPVRGCWHGQADHATVAPSLTAWVEDFVTALERGGYTEDPERGTFQRK